MALRCNNYGGERRRRGRTVIDKPAEIELHGNPESILGIVMNVSTTGMSILTDRPLAIGGKVTVRATLDGDQHGVQGQIVQVQGRDAEHWIIGVEYDLLMLEEDPFMLEALSKTIELR